MIATAGAISGDNMQDLKTGHMIQATPWKQQLMLILGVVVSSLAMPPILNLLNDAYGFGTNGLLPAPQASLMLSVSKGVILGGLPWGWVAIGGGVAVGVIVIDTLLKRYQVPFAMPVLGFAVGFCKRPPSLLLLSSLCLADLPLATGVPIM
jgi:putative OPT family oligopeptide transporter